MFLNTDFLQSDEICLRLIRTTDANPEKQFVPAYRFAICLPDGTEVGRCDLRIGHNDKLFYGGNIGYAVDEPYRGHHYAAKACVLLLELARRHELGFLYITCSPENVASAKTCLRAGGRFMGIHNLPEDHDMYLRGERQVMVYRFDL